MIRRNGSCHRARWLVTVSAIVAATPLAAQVDWMRARLAPHELATMAYDSARGRMVLFGTAYGAGLLPVTDHTTWEWDRGTWFERTSANFPTTREVMGLAFDAARGKTVLFGGYSGTASLDDTWLWDGVDWALASSNPQPGPSPRHCYSLAYDAARQEVVLFGGYDLTNRTRFNDTWVWNGTSWRQCSPQVTPPARTSHALVYDAARQEVVMFGGYGAGPTRPMSDTWTWNGTNWTQPPVSVSPAPRGGHGLAYDSARQVVVLFGGFDLQFAAYNDTWEWNGSTWTRPSPAISAPGRYFHAMAYLPGTGTLVAGGFAGIRGNRIVPGRADTWSWDGTNWTLLESAKAPPVRSEHAATFDPLRRRSVVFGGTYLPSGGLRQDTWEWDGAAWHELAPAASPSARRGAAMAWDGINQQCLLFGGYAAPAGMLGDTWLWNGTTWTNPSPPNSPTSSRLHAMVWDEARNQIVLFGGLTTTGVLSGTWTWNGTNWTQSPAVGPSARYGHAMAFDRSSQTVLLFGGLPLNSQTWQWNGVAWTQLSPAASPTPRYAHAMAHDPLRNAVVLTAGRDNTGPLNDAWEWNGSTWQRQALPSTPPEVRASHSMTVDPLDRLVVFGGADATLDWNDTWLYGGLQPATVTTSGTGCPGTAAPRIASSVPQIGSGLGLDLLDLRPNASCLLVLGVVKASTPVGPCTFYIDVSQPHLGVPGVSSATGFATTVLSIPLDPTLTGLSLTAQGIALDLTAPAPLTFTPALDLVLGG